jgi:hypothetical protein
MENILEIVPSSHKYSDFINRLIKITSDDHMMIPIHKVMTVQGKKFDTTYIALLDKEPVGFYSIWTNNFHPHSLYFYIIIEDKYLQRKIGTALFRHMLTLNIDLTYLQCSFYETASAGSYFLEHLGFKRYRTTQEDQIDIKHVKSQPDHYFLKENDLKISTLTALKSDKEILELAEIVKQTYIDAHLDNPVQNISTDVWKNLILDDVIKDGSFIIKKDNKMIAFALMHACDASSMDLGWRGVTDAFDYIRPGLIEILTLKQIEYAQNHEIFILNTEIDDTDKWSTDMLGFLNLKKKKRWISYQKPMKS